MPKSALGLVLLLVAYVSGQQPPPSPGGQAAAERNQTGTLRQIIPGHYVYSYATYNSGIIVTSEGLVVLDALNSEAVARAQREAMASAIREPVRVLVSSTFHNNYSKGNIAYADVLKIGHEHYRTDLLDLMHREKVSAAEQTARLPNQTFRDRMTLYLGGKEIQILYVGRAHTRGDSIIFVPQDRIAYLSELYFADQFLFINDGYGIDWLRALDAVEALGAEIYRARTWTDSGRPSGNPPRAPRFRQMLVDVRDAVQTADCARRNGGSGGGGGPMAAVRKDAGIRHATGNRRAAVVSAIDRQAPLTGATGPARRPCRDQSLATVRPAGVRHLGRDQSSQRSRSL